MRQTSPSRLVRSQTLSTRGQSRKKNFEEGYITYGCWKSLLEETAIDMNRNIEEHQKGEEEIPGRGTLCVKVPGWQSLRVLQG